MSEDKLDQGFNDSELEEIMEEIESLEEDELVQGKNNSSVDTDNNVVEISKNKKPTSGKQKSSMELAVTGDMELNITFNLAGQKVDLVLDGEEGFCIQLPGGAQFKVPFENQAKQTKAS